MRCAFPAAAEIKSTCGPKPEMRWVIDFIEGVRQIRGELDIAPSRKLEVLLQNAAPQMSNIWTAICTT